MVVQLATLVALAVAIITLRDTWRIAERSGSFERPAVQIGFGGIPIDGSEAELIALIPKRCSAHPVLMEIPLTIYNSGEKAASNLSVSLQFPLDNGRSPAPGQDSSSLFSGEGPPVTTVTRAVHDAAKWRYVTYSAGRLLPRTSIQVGEPIEAPLPISVDLSEADPRFSGSARLSYSLQVPVVIAFDDERVVTAKMNVTAMQADTVQEAGRALNQHVAALRTRAPVERAGLRRWVAWLMPAPKGRAFIAQPESVECGSKEGSMAFTRSISVLEYRR
jgi:hypothetical protein